MLVFFEFGVVAGFSNDLDGVLRGEGLFGVEKVGGDNHDAAAVAAGAVDKDAGVDVLLDVMDGAEELFLSGACAVEDGDGEVMWLGAKAGELDEFGGEVDDALGGFEDADRAGVFVG